MLTLVGMSPVVTNSDINIVYDALDWWRDFLVRKHHLSFDERREMLIRHSDFAQGRK